MFDRSDPATFWLNVTNSALGIAVGICVLVVLYGVAREIHARLRGRVTEAETQHTFVVPGLGVTMADGGTHEDSPTQGPKDGRR